MTRSVSPGHAASSSTRAGAAVRHVLEIVQHQQHGPIAQRRPEPVDRRPVARLPHPDHPGHGRQDEVRLDERRQGHEPGVPRERRRDLLGHAQGEAGLADAAGAGQGQEAHVGAAQQLDSRVHLPFAADERGQRDRQGWAGPNLVREGDQLDRLAAAVGWRRSGHGWVLP